MRITGLTRTMAGKKLKALGFELIKVYPPEVLDTVNFDPHTEIGERYDITSTTKGRPDKDDPRARSRKC